MATVDPTRFGDLCRLCATKTTLILGINIFENEGSIRQLGKKIETCLPIHVHQSDELPKMICENCLYKLELLFDFRERSLRTERLLLELIKGFSTQIQDDPSSLSVVPMDNSGLIMVHHQLLSDNISNVELDLHHLNQREGIIVGNEIILSQENVNLGAHSLQNLDLNHHELTHQDISNHSLQTQDSILVDTSNSHSVQDAHFTEETLTHPHILGDQYRLQELHVEVNGGSIKADLVAQNQNVAGSENVNERSKPVNDFHIASKIKPNNHNLSYVHREDTSCDNDVPLSHLPSQNFDLIEKNSNIDLASFKQDESNSDNSLFIDERINNIHEAEKVYVLQSSNDISNTLHEVLNNVNSDYVYCNICGKTYKDKNELNSHYEVHFHKCSICLAVFTSNNLLNNHRKEAHGTCEEDSTLSNIKLEETNFSSKQTENISDESESCENNQDDGDEIEESAESKDGKKKKWSPKVCKECGKSYKTNYKLTEHMRKHTGEKPYKCSSCEKAFRSKIGLAQHEAKHTGHYDYACPTCGKGFQCKSYLMVHQRVHSDLKPYPCTTCGSNFKTKQSLLDHTNRHLGVKPFMCEICGRGFITKGLCKAHQKIHTGLDNRKYSCKICNKMFVSKSYLQTHLRIHTGEKPFMCEVCGKGFLTRVDLRIHSTMHTGEKSYVCEICGKAFARRDALRCHRRSHTGERPYSCDLCGQTFTQFTPMAIHKRLHTGERPYSCEVCGKTFVSRSTMMSHAKKHIT